jgi:hypothetical protein
LPFSRRKRCTDCQKANDLAREAVGCNGGLGGYGMSGHRARAKLLLLRSLLWEYAAFKFCNPIALLFNNLEIPSTLVPDQCEQETHRADGETAIGEGIGKGKIPW